MPEAKTTCEAAACGRSVVRQGLCVKHYNRKARGENVNRESRRDPLSVRFWRKVDKHESGCWLWTGAKTRNGYGRACTDGKTVVAHRVAYELGVGPIPDGLTLDHLCRNRACVNPAHLEPVTDRTNILRGDGPAAVNARKTHCNKGHPFTPANTRTTNAGYRVCRECDRAGNRVRKRRARLLRALLAAPKGA